MILYDIPVLWYIWLNWAFNCDFQIQSINIAFQIYSSYCALIMKIRLLKQSDNPVLAKIIRDTLTEFGANHPGIKFSLGSTTQKNY